MKSIFSPFPSKTKDYSPLPSVSNSFLRASAVFLIMGGTSGLGRFCTSDVLKGASNTLVRVRVEGVN